VRTLLVASALAGEGKSLVARDLALTYADAGQKVAILEADLRRPTMARLLDVNAEPGLTDVFSQAEILRSAIQRVSSSHPLTPTIAIDESDTSALLTIGEGTRGSLDVLTAGAPAETLTAAVAAEAIKSVLSRLTEEYDVVIIDSAPLLLATDAVPLLTAVDGVLLVARVGKTTEDAAKRVGELLGRVERVRVLGLVANDLPRKPLEYYSTEYVATASA
jgi:Mrp family chromosome partitioning ATPase